MGISQLRQPPCRSWKADGGVADVLADITTTCIPALNNIWNLGSLFERQVDIGNARMICLKASEGYDMVVGASNSKSVVIRRTSRFRLCDRDIITESA